MHLLTHTFLHLKLIRRVFRGPLETVQAQVSSEHGPARPKFGHLIAPSCSQWLGCFVHSVLFTLQLRLGTLACSP